MPARALQDERGGGQNASDRPSAVRTVIHGGFRDALADLEGPPAAGALIFVSEHEEKDT